MEVIGSSLSCAHKVSPAHEAGGRAGEAGEENHGGGSLAMEREGEEHKQGGTSVRIGLSRGRGTGPGKQAGQNKKDNCVVVHKVSRCSCSIHKLKSIT